MEEQQEQAFSFLFKKFVCITAVADPKLGTWIVQELEKLPFMRVIACDTAGRAETAILSQDRVHCCVCGAGLADRHGDELYLLKRFGDSIPVVMYLPGASAAFGAECMWFDAAAVISDENDASRSPQFLVEVCARIVEGVLFPFRSLQTCKSLRSSLEILFKKKPCNVSSWAELCSVSRRNLCGLWSDHCKTSAHYALVCHELLCCAFAWYLNEVFDRGGLNDVPSACRKRTLLSRKYYDQLEDLHPLMFKKRNYRLLPLRQREHVGFYDAVVLPGSAAIPVSLGKNTPKNS